MKVSAFDFDLPDEAIALRPASPRDHARLLQVSGDGNFSDYHVFDLPRILRSGDILVLNETRVFPAALTATRKARPVGGGGDVKIAVNLHQKKMEDRWLAFVRPAKRLKVGDCVYFGDSLSAEVTEKNSGGEVELLFDKAGDALMAAIDKTGTMPIPPYIARQRQTDERDVSDYQTIYAVDTGSVAAPTAGLHFTERLMKALIDKGVQFEKVVLHVGAGTFLPVSAEDTSDHEMHTEWFSINEQTAANINQAKQEGRRIIAVGTTSLRAIESNVENGQLKAGAGETDIFITPGYDFEIIDGLMTNFHLPKSTLFMLVSALTGFKVMRKAYQYAIANGFRFYSYGDSSLLWRQN